MSRSPLLRAASLWAPVVVVMGAIGYLSVRTVVGRPAVPRLDKVAHAAAYASLALVLARALRGAPRLTRGEVALAAFLWATGFGAVLEMVQRFVPERSADLFDLLANAVGAVLAALGWWVASARLGARR